MYKSTNMRYFIYTLTILYFLSSCRSTKVYCVREKMKTNDILNINTKNKYYINNKSISNGNYLSELFFSDVDSIKSNYYVEFNFKNKNRLTLKLKNEKNIIVAEKQLKGKSSINYFETKSKYSLYSEYLLLNILTKNNYRISFLKSGNLIVSGTSSGILFLIVFPMRGADSELCEEFELIKLKKQSKLE